MTGGRWEPEGEPEARHSFRMSGIDYRWLTCSDDRRHLGVFVTTEAQEAVDEHALVDEAIRDAVQTHGRSLIEALGEVDDPPEWFTVRTDRHPGRTAGCRPPELMAWASLVVAIVALLVAIGVGLVNYFAVKSEKCCR